MQKRNIPKFKSEQEEAEWWDRRRDETAQWMEEAVAAGQTAGLLEILQRKQAGTTPTASIRIDPEDITRATALSAQKGLRYQTYLKMLLHEALIREGNAR